MASALAFDTHAYVKRLRDVGVPENQAEVQVEAIAALVGERMVTKHDQQVLEISLKRDLKELETRLEVKIAEIQRDIKELETRLGRDLKELEMRLIVRLGGLGVVGIGVVVSLIKLL